ncbi:hypothetical protein MIMGU_mgv1a023847mg, partial [Erythranthe guttata]
ARDESEKKSLLVLPPLVYEEIESFFSSKNQNKMGSDLLLCGNDLEDPKLKIMTVNRYRLVRNLIQIHSNTYRLHKKHTESILFNESIR